jgi:hypothetical protein
MNIMDYTYTNADLDFFLKNIFFDTIVTNDGGMSINDMFSFFFLLNKLKPKVIIESGVWNGKSTQLMRKTLGNDVILICLDPREIPADGYRDQTPNTYYFTGNEGTCLRPFVWYLYAVVFLMSARIKTFKFPHESQIFRKSFCFKLF